MSADIQRRRAKHKAALLETKAGKRSSCLPGKEAKYSTLPKKKKNKSQLSEPAEKWPIHIQDIGAVFKD